MKLGIIITTYNRPKKVLELYKSLKSIVPENVIITIVDSSEITNSELNFELNENYVKSNHKNQPFQRYLGYLNNSSDLLLYLDDDMEIYNKSFYEIILEAFLNKDIVGLAIKFINKQEDSLSEIPKTKIKLNQISRKIIGNLTGYPSLDEGLFGYCGIRGNQPQFGGLTQWISGGAFVAKRKYLFKNFNFQLFDLFENKLGMGEDAIIGYTLSKQGNIYYSPVLMFLHNDNKDSNYSTNHLTFSKRVTFSRLYLTLEKARLDNKNFIYPYFLFHWFVLFRNLGLFISFMQNRNKSTFNMLKGAFLGWYLAAFNYKFRYNNSISKYRI
jgi:glycosyltransferase involved in cell wall biosynthesis